MAMLLPNLLWLACRLLVHSILNTAAAALLRRGRGALGLTGPKKRKVHLVYSQQLMPQFIDRRQAGRFYSV